MQRQFMLIKMMFQFIKRLKIALIRYPSPPPRLHTAPHPRGLGSRGSLLYFVKIPLGATSTILQYTIDITIICCVDSTFLLTICMLYMFEYSKMLICALVLVYFLPIVLKDTVKINSTINLVPKKTYRLFTKL